MKWKVLISLVALAALAALLLLREKSSKRTFSDGTRMVLSDLKIGRTNTYTHGTMLSKTLGRFAPSNGVFVGKLKLERPKKLELWFPESEALSAQLRILPGSTNEASFINPPFYRKRRLLIYGENNFPFVAEFEKFTSYPEGIFLHFYTSRFPRDSRMLRFRLEERDRQNSGEWRELGTFVLPNPRPARVQPWVATKAPHFRFPDDIDIQVGEVTVARERIHPTDIWETMALLPFRVTQRGQVLTNWGISESKVWDASGNFDWFSGPKAVTNDWIVWRGFRPLDPDKPWRFKVAFGMDTDFPATNLHSFTLSWPIGAVIQTNFGGFPVQVHSSSVDYLTVEMMRKPRDVRLTFVGAVISPLLANIYMNPLDHLMAQAGKESMP